VTAQVAPEEQAGVRWMTVTSQARRRLSRAGRTSMLAVAWFGAWQAATILADHPYFPSPIEIAATASRLWFSGPVTQLFLSDTVLRDVLPSLGRLAAGWGIAALLGVVLGLGLGRSPRAQDYTRVPLGLARAVPQPLLVPIFLVLFGLTSTMEIVAIVCGTVWPILLSAADGARGISPHLRDTMRAFRLSRIRWALWIVLPAAAPKIFTGLRVSASIGLIIMIVSELAGSTNGIGYQLTTARAIFDLPVMWCWIALLAILGFTFNELLHHAQQRLLPWHRAEAHTSGGGL
jgi:ABC-type nitrate/sulfonate/bicarbonate transport system permease component